AEGVTSNKINQWIKQRQIIFILDGFDEIPPEKRDEIQQWIQELNIAIKNCPIVITSRPLTTNHLEELGEQWELFEIKPFDEPRIIDYIQRWYKYTSLLADSDREINVKVLAQQWQSDPTIEPLTSNPLLLSTLLMVHHLDGSLPSGRSELYNRYVKGMLGLWDDRRKVKAHKISLSLKEKWQILRGIALYMNFEQKDQLDEGEITQQLDRILEEMKLTCSAEDVLETLRERSGLIIGPGIYSFIHKSVGEYLVADAINQGDQRDTSGTRIDRLTLFDYRDKDRWNTIIFLWAGIASVKDLENFIDSCIEAKSYRLALGILYDQYEKFSTIYRKNLIDKLLCGQIELGFPQRSVYYKYYAPFDYYSTYIPRALKIRSYNLRSITEDIGIERLLLKVVNKGDVSWSNMKNPQNEIRDFLWTFFTVKIENFDDWKKSIAADPPCNGNNELWFILTADRIAFKFFYGQIDFNVDQVYQKCEETISSLQGLIIIYLINAVVQIDIDFFCKDDVQLRLNQTLNFILNAPKESIDSNLLEGTKIWICYALDSVMDIQDKTLEEIFDVQDIKDLDLLLNFKNKIQSLFDMGSIIDQNTFQSVIKFTDDLIKMRDDAVLVSREDGKAIAETIYLNSIPGMVDSIKSAAAEPLSEGMPLEELDW
ncbi:MAG: NACHT domain-containing protein, partial [Cyanobacteria bacterium J06558_2]